MIYRFVLPGALICSLFAACGTESGNSASYSIDGALVLEHARTLASDNMMGRRAGTKGHEMATDYVARHFSNLGLEPFPGERGYCQRVPLSRARLDTRRSSLVVGETAFPAQSADLVIEPPLDGAESAVSAELVFVGYGIQEADYGLTPYSKVEVAGKVVVYLNGFPDSLPGLTGAYWMANKASYAAQAGALATIEIETPASLARRPWHLIRGFFSKPFAAWVSGEGVPADGLETVRSTVRTTGAISPLLFKNAPVTLDKVFSTQAEKGDVGAFELDQTVAINRSSSIERLGSCNTLGVLPGRDGSLGDEPLVFMAHIDHMGVEGSETFNGYYDNALGVAILLDVARVFAGLPQSHRPRRPIIFAAVTAEEEGMLGSDYLARRSFNSSNLWPVAAFNIDMPLLGFEFSDLVVIGEEQSSLGSIARKAAAELNIRLSVDADPARGSFVRSDHYSFVKQGIPAVRVEVGSAGAGAAAKAVFYSRHYHRPSDNAELSVNLDSLQRYADMHVEMVRRTADLEKRPHWLEGMLFHRVHVAVNESKETAR